MASFPIFVINEGEPKILTSYFHTDSKPLARGEIETSLPPELTIFGDNKSRSSVFVHLLVDDLTGVNSKRKLVPRDTKIVVDLFAVQAAAARAARAKNRLEEGDIADAIYGATVEIDLGEQKLEVPATTLSQRVETVHLNTRGYKRNSDLHVTTLLSEPGHTIHQLCFELPLDDFYVKNVEPFYSLRVLGWAWLLSPFTREQYQKGFWGMDGEKGLDISKRAERMKFLENQGSLWRHVDAFSERTRMYLREEYESAPVPPGCRDPFVYDEPTRNSLRFSRSMPFRHFELGSQLDAIGLSSNNLATRLHPFDWALHKGTYHAFSLDGVLPTSASEEKNASKSGFAVNEVPASCEEQYLFRVGTATQWLNVIETHVRGAGGRLRAQPKPNEVLTAGQLPFDGGASAKVSILSHDFMEDYRPLHDGRPTNLPDHSRPVAPEPRVFEYKELDLGEYKTISLPQATLKSSAGAVLGELGKGIPGLDRWGWSQSGGPSRFLGALHTRVRVEGYRGDWEAHPYCQRPLLLSYELDRDLAENEAAFLEETWAARDEPSRLSPNALVLCFELPPGDRTKWNPSIPSPVAAYRALPAGLAALASNPFMSLFGESPSGKLPFPMETAGERTAVIPLPFLSRECGKAGKHLVALYLSPAPLWEEGGLHVTVSVRRGDALEPLYEGPKREPRLVFLARAPKSITVYQARSLQSDSLSGLFEGNPVVAIDSLTPLERRRAVEDEAEKGIERSKKLKGAKLVLGFVPRYGEALGKALEAGYAVAENAREADKPFPAGKVASAALETLQTILEQMSAKGSALARVAEAAGETTKTSKLMVETLTDLATDLESLEAGLALARSPFKRLDKFMRSGAAQDAVIALRVLENRFDLESTREGIVANRGTQERVAAFCIRWLKEGDPLVYAFGPRGGWLERRNPDDQSSLLALRNDFQERLIGYKRALKGVATFEEYLRWLKTPANIAQGGLNAGLEGFLEKYASAVAEALAGRPSQAAQSREAAAAQHVWRYLHDNRIVCPVCKNEMDPGWQWCPYHPMEPKLRGMQDANRSGSWKDEFLDAFTAYLKKQEMQEISLLKYLGAPPGKPSIFVHCSDFVVLN